MKLRQIFIQNLKYYRKKLGVRQLDLALEIGKSSNYINSIENGKYFPSPETIEQISQVLKIDPMQLFDKNNPETDTNKTFNNSRLAELEIAKTKLKAEVINYIEQTFTNLQTK